jgi:beta-galactosidase
MVCVGRTSRFAVVSHFSAPIKVSSMPQLSRREILRTGLALSASSLFASSAAAHAEALLASYPGASPAESLAPRERFLLDFDWKFFQGHASDPDRDLGFGSDQGDFSKSGHFGFANAKFDDSKWRSLNLPHDWAVELPFVHDQKLDGHGYKPLGRRYPETSIGWYRRSFDLPETDRGRRIVVDFDGAFRSALIFFNGYFIGRNDNGYAPFSFDLTDFAIYGGKNSLVVRMDASFGDGWFYEGAGIYRHVWLTKTSAVHLGQWESFVRPELKGSVATLALGTLVRNSSPSASASLVRWKILDATGNTVATAVSATQQIGPGSETPFSASAKIANPALWSPETPALYKAILTVESGGKTVDAEQHTFGVRTLRFDADKGFFLNGKSVKIKGTCNHQDHAGVGAALPDRLQWYRLALLKEMGGNAVRTSHNMPTPEWVEACDRMGMMMMCETRMMSSTPEGLEQYATMVKRFRNSPAIILWSIGNEEGRLQGNPEGERVAATMIALSHQLDPTRQCTAAVNNGYGKGISKALEVEGFNYNLSAIEPYHKAHPLQPLIGSETASAVSTRGIYSTDKLRNWVSAYDLNYPKWAETAETWWKFYAEREYLPGGFAWTGFDYRGEPTPYGWPSINSQFGILDMCGFPKDTFFYYKAWWGADPVLHLFPHWNWEDRNGEQISVWVHSNCDEVELFLNGKSMGSQKVPKLGHLEWKVNYVPGTLEARGSNGGKVILTEKRETTGAVASLRLTADRTSIDADGEDIAVLRIEGIDAQGRVVPTADDMIHFKVSGAGVLLGVGNGDPNCQESDKAPARSLFNGLAQLIVQSLKAPGEIVVEASRSGLSAAKLTITTSRVDLRATL